MSGFDPGKLNDPVPTQQSSRPKSERVIVEVSHYETPDNAPHFAVGKRLNGDGEDVRVRLNTVDERVADRPSANPETIRSQYITGEFTRESIADKAKSEIKLIAFDDSRKIGTNDSGATEYRAHWPTTMAADKSAEVVMGLAHVRLEPAREEQGVSKKAQAYVEMINDAKQLDKDGAKDALTSALSIRDEDGRGRNPLVILRAQYENQVVSETRIYPATEASTRFDQNEGKNVDINVKVDGDKTLAKLLDGEKGRTSFDDMSKDTARALVAGITGGPEPKFNSDNAEHVSRATNLYHGVKEGHVQVQMIEAERIDFGADSRMSYLNKAEGAQFKPYSVPLAGTENNDRGPRFTAGFTETAVAVQRHDDGTPFAVYASPVEMYPKGKPLREISAEQINPTLAEAAPKPTPPAEEERKQQAPELTM